MDSSTSLLHEFPEHTPFDRKLQIAEIESLGARMPRAACAGFVENYARLQV